MSPPALSRRLIHEVQQAVANHAPRDPTVGRDQLGALVRAVLSSVDLRDLRGVSGEQLVEQLEHVLAAISRRKRGEIVVHVHDEEDGHVVIETCMEDQPFLVSTMRALLAVESMEVRHFLNAIVKVRRDPAGRLVDVGEGVPESIMRIDAVCEHAVPASFAERVAGRLRLAQAMVRDFPAMTARLETLADRFFMVAEGLEGERAEQLREAEALLRWLSDENLVLLSVEQYDEHGEPVEMLGISSIRQSTRRPDLISVSGVDRRLVRFERSPEESPVHRAGKPGYFVMPRFDEDAQPRGTFVIYGLFTYRALHTPPEQIPFIRMALRDMLKDRSVDTTSHRGKSITNAFNSLPLEYLLSERRESIWEVTDRILRAEVEGGSDVHIRIDEKSRFAFVIVTLPRSQFNEELRQQVQDILISALGGTYADYGIYIDRYDNVVMHFYVTGPGPLAAVDKEQLRDQILALARGWSERLREALRQLVGDGGADKVDDLYEVYVDAFSDEHKRRASVERLRGDLRCLETLRAGETIDCDLFVSEFGDHPGSLQLRIFSRQAMNLSQELPVISDFGFTVIDEYSRTVRIPHMPEIDMDNFRVEIRSSRIGQIMGRRERILEALRMVFAGAVGDDDLNRLIVVSDLNVRDVEILRALVAYLHQIRVPFAGPLIRQTLVEHPQVTSSMMEDLYARFGPEDVAPDPARARRRMEAELREVTDFTADRVLSAVAEVVRAVVRTNAFVAEHRRGEAFSFKLAAAELSFGRDPKPFREIWVYHPDFEGVHLRGGKIARGGLRFSDRPDDFRTEIHDLMATQMVKNVLIVPVGAKGGFVLRHPPKARDRLRAAGDHYYRAFIGALLSVTDNVVDGVPVPPEGIRYTEDPDPYLVVAADKGTAHLSDTANAISMARGYWMDDAFASGGTHGYDHKKTGITARGAWETAKRCFREIGIDPERDVITAVGVGDMSGDVFGNGMLRTRTMKLRAAFNHMHIFVDPDPDPERSYLERKRLFDLGRSQWTDYDASVLSEGGGVYPRASKEVPLSPQARAMLGFDPEEPVDGDRVIRAILSMEVDLLWMGGIGTYIRSREESDADVADKANDGARITADRLRCRVLAEGANLSITERGRVVFARRGGLNYTAFLDNSGGVDTSDHEVNIKILFAPLVAADEVTRDRRNELLEGAEDEVVEAVLDNNRSQSRMVSFDVTRSRADIYRYARTMQALVRDVPFDPDAFALPSEDDLAARARKGGGLFKCEAAVLCAHAKMLAYRELLEAEPLDASILRAMSQDYFPESIRKALGARGDAAIAGHLLHREIGTTMVVNHIVDNAGATLFPEVMAATGCGARDVAHAYMQAIHAGRVDAILADLYACESPANQQAVYDAMMVAQGAIEDAVYYHLDQAGGDLLSQAAMGQVHELMEAAPKLAERVRARGGRATNERVEQLVENGIAPELARRIGDLRHLAACLDSIRLAGKLGVTPSDALERRMTMARRVGLDRLVASISRIALAAPWDGPAVNALGRHLEFHLHKLVLLTGDASLDEVLSRYHMGPIRELVAEHLERGLDIPGLVMLDDQFRRFLPAEADIRG